MKLEYRHNLLFTSLEITFRGKCKIIENIVVDTGAAESIISPDAVEDIGIVAEAEDSVDHFYAAGGGLNTFYSKKIDALQIGDAKLQSLKMDFGVIDPKGAINGLLGLDILMELGTVIDLGQLTMDFKHC